LSFEISQSSTGPNPPKAKTPPLSPRSGIGQVRAVNPGLQHPVQFSSETNAGLLNARSKLFDFP
jgi:hypothetical protein